MRHGPHYTSPAMVSRRPEAAAAISCLRSQAWALPLLPFALQLCWLSDIYLVRLAIRLQMGRPGLADLENKCIHLPDGIA